MGIDEVDIAVCTCGQELMDVIHAGQKKYGREYGGHITCPACGEEWDWLVDEVGYEMENGEPDYAWATQISKGTW